MKCHEAIRILDMKTSEKALAEIEYYNGFRGREAVLKAVDDACVLAVAALREQEERGKLNGVDFDTFKNWIPVTERLPESQKTVLVSAKDKTFGHRHTMMAAHIGHREAKTEDYGWQEYEGDTEYDEENDCFWIPECWWESNFVEDNTNWIIGSDYEITHWMPLPEPPKEDA